MIVVSVTIDFPLESVWKYFIQPSNWSNWRGKSYGLKEVIPSWTPGAKLVWEAGGSSVIGGIVPKREITILSQWSDSKYTFKNSGPSSTVVTHISFDPKGGARFSDGGAAYKIESQSELQKLKSSIENDLPRKIQNQQRDPIVQPYQQVAGEPIAGSIARQVADSFNEKNQKDKKKDWKFWKK